jgi:hypothetical protein
MSAPERDQLYREAIVTVDGSVVANHMLRELLDALGESDHARPEHPATVWEDSLRRVRQLRDHRP